MDALSFYPIKSKKKIKMVMQYYMSLFVQVLLHIYQIYIEISIELTYETQKISSTYFDTFRVHFICYISILDIGNVDTIQRL